MNRLLTLAAVVVTISLPAMAATNELGSASVPMPLSATDTNPPPTISAALQEMATAIADSTNWTLIFGYGRALTGNRSLGFSDLAYNFSDYVGVVLGGDYLWSPGNHVFNTVKGGVTLQAPIHPFSFLGSGWGAWTTNVAATPYISDCLSQPQGSGNNMVGNIATVGAQVNLFMVKNFRFSISGMYESRSGQGYWNGKYPAGWVGLTKSFK